MQSLHASPPETQVIEPGQIYEAVRAFVAYRLHAERRLRTPLGFFEALFAEPAPVFDPLVEFTPGHGDLGPFRVLKVEAVEAVEGVQGPRVICELVRDPHVQFQTHGAMIQRQCERVSDLFIGRVVQRAIRVRVA